MTRSEHVEWCKKRALEYIDNGQIQEAYSSMVSDLRLLKETSNHSGIELGMMLLMSGHLSTPEKMSKFILGFN